MQRLKQNRVLMMVLIAAAGGLALACALCVAAAALNPKTPTPTALARLKNTPAQAAQATDTPKAPATAKPTEAPKPSNTPRSTDTPKPTATPRPTNTPVPTVPPTLPPKPVTLQGQGQHATDPIALPYPLSVVRFTHAGSSNFAVWTYIGKGKNLLVNTIGHYEGTRPLFSNEPVVFDIKADGTWTINIAPIGQASGAAFSGRGDSVSGLFDPPTQGPWLFKHDGQSNFAVWLYCTGGQDLVQNAIGPVDGSRIVQFPKGPCCWDVKADGNWSLAPR